MDPDELTDSLSAQLAQPGGNDESHWDGRTATNPQTGERIIYRVSPGGRGRWVQLTPGTAPAQDRERIQGEAARLSVLRRLAPLSSQFNAENRREPTGSWWQSDGGRGVLGNTPFAWTNPDSLRRLDRMRGLEAEAVRANIVPGTSGTANSVFEQQLLREMFPNREAVGSANSDRMISLHVERDLQARRLQEMEAWLTQNPDLGQFESRWSSIEPQLRRDLDQRYRYANVPQDAGSAIGADVGAAGARLSRSPGQPESRPTRNSARRRYNPASGRIE